MKIKQGRNKTNKNAITKNDCFFYCSKILDRLIACQRYRDKNLFL